MSLRTKAKILILIISSRSVALVAKNIVAALRFLRKSAVILSLSAKRFVGGVSEAPLKIKIIRLRN